MENIQNLPETPSQTREKMKVIGGLWKRKSKDGKKGYLSGSLNVENEFGEKQRLKITIWPNHWKEDEKDQDYLIYFDGYRERKNKQTDKIVTEKPEDKYETDDWTDKTADSSATKKIPF